MDKVFLIGVFVVWQVFQIYNENGRCVFLWGGGVFLKYFCVVCNYVMFNFFSILSTKPKTPADTKSRLIICQ